MARKNQSAALPLLSLSLIDFFKDSTAVFQSPARYAANPKVFQHTHLLGSRSTAFRAESSASFGSNQGSPGTLTNAQARLFCALEFSGWKMVASRRYRTAEPRSSWWSEVVPVSKNCCAQSIRSPW